MAQDSNELDEVLDAMASFTLEFKDNMSEEDLARAKPMVVEAIGWAQEWVQKRRPTKEGAQ